MSVENGQPTSSFAHSSSAFPLPESAGVASLDSPLVQQTKSEIRTIAAEIAELSQAAISPEEFYEGVLPRLCTAMGARSAMIWKITREQSYEMLAAHAEPAEFEDGAVVESHQRILRSAVAEDQPVLVPPGSVSLEVKRPTNPLSDALILIPIRFEENTELLLEVVQRPSGGPTAQRGYIRFVAQMADLVADFGRRHRIREYAQNDRRRQQLEHWLLQVAQARAGKLRGTQIVDALTELVEADCGLLTDLRPGFKMNAVSGVAQADPRSQPVLLGSRLAKETARLTPIDQRAFVWHHATDRRIPNQSVEPRSAEVDDVAPGALQQLIDELCDAWNCRRILIVDACSRDDATRKLWFVAGFRETCAQPEQQKSSWQEQVVAWCESFTSLYLDMPRASGVYRLLPNRSSTNTSRRRVWGVRLLLMAMMVAAAFFPVPQQVGVTAILQPVHKNPYFAPYDAMVSSVGVREGDDVEDGQTLLVLTSRELNSQIDQLEGQLRSTSDRLAQLHGLLQRGSDLERHEQDRYEGELEQLKIESESLSRQIELLHVQRGELLISARQNGTVSTWDLENRLLHKPVKRGELLLSTHDYQGAWRLRLAIPEYRAGLVAAAIEDANATNSPTASLTEKELGTRVQFALSSHPDEIHEATLNRLASHTSGQSGDPNNLLGSTVIGEATLDPTQLPLRKDGAIAQATIDCGKVPLAWLVMRDAWWAIGSRLRMYW